jgi:hypothetical protein
MAPPSGVDLVALAQTVRYVGSVEHKRYPSFAGHPRPRADATLCDPTFKDADELTSVLAGAMRDGAIGAPWEVDYPRYVWARMNGTWYEARLVNPVLGEYKGYALTAEDDQPRIASAP